VTVVFVERPTGAGASVPVASRGRDAVGGRTPAGRGRGEVRPARDRLAASRRRDPAERFGARVGRREQHVEGSAGNVGPAGGASAVRTARRSVAGRASTCVTSALQFANRSAIAAGPPDRIGASCRKSRLWLPAVTSGGAPSVARGRADRDVLVRAEDGLDVAPRDRPYRRELRRAGVPERVRDAGRLRRVDERARARRSEVRRATPSTPTGWMGRKRVPARLPALAAVASPTGPAVGAEVGRAPRRTRTRRPARAGVPGAVPSPI
jgi:hypothetical protein